MYSLFIFTAVDSLLVKNRSTQFAVAFPPEPTVHAVPEALAHEPVGVPGAGPGCNSEVRPSRRDQCRSSQTQTIEEGAGAYHLKT